MANILRAEEFGTVANVYFGEGETLVPDSVILN